MEMMSRRTFLKGSAAGACGVAAMSILPGCTSRVLGQEQQNPTQGPRKILILIGASPAGNTVKLADSFAEGAKENGRQVTSIFLGGRDIRCCLGCDQCRYGRGCVQKDEMSEIYEAVEEADLIVFASALRYWTLTGVIKNVLERLYATCSEDQNPPKGRYEKYPDRECALLMSAADDNWWTFEQALSYYQHVIVNYLGWRDRGHVLAGGAGGCGGPKHIEDTGGLEMAYDFGKTL